jgi:hypothetical protein
MFAVAAESDTLYSGIVAPKCTHLLTSVGFP